MSIFHPHQVKIGTLDELISKFKVGSTGRFTVNIISKPNYSQGCFYTTAWF